MADEQIYHTERFEKFAEAYRKGLAKAMKDHPDEYMPGLSAEIVAEKMIDKIKTKGIGAVSVPQSKGFKNACKELGIKQTYKEIGAYLKGL